MSVEKVASPSRKGSFTISFNTVFKPVKRTTQFCIEALSRTASRSISPPIGHTPTPHPLIQRIPTTYRNPVRNKSCTFSKEEILKSAAAPSPNLEDANKLCYPYGYPEGEVKLYTADQLAKTLRFRKSEMERRMRKDSDLICK